MVVILFLILSPGFRHVLACQFVLDTYQTKYNGCIQAPVF